MLAELKTFGRRLLPFSPAIIAGLCLVALGVYLDAANIQQLDQRLRETMLMDLSSIRAKLENNIATDAQTIRGLVAAICAEPDLDQERFSALARPLIRDRSSLRNIGAAPDLVIRFMYPIDGNQAAIGLDYRRVPEQIDAVERARRSGELILAGPVDLVQGGQGLIARVPVFLPSATASEPGFWGLVSAVIDPDQLFAASGLLGGSHNMEIAIRGKDATGAKGEVFFGKKDVFASKPVVVDVVLPHGSWQMAAVPREGWPKHADMILVFRSTFIGFSSALLAVLVILGRLMEENRDNDARLRGLFELSPIGIALNDYETGGFIEVNDSLVRPTGYTREELMRLRYWDITPQEFGAAEARQLEELEKTGRYGPYEKEYLRKDGSRYPVLLRGLVVYDSSKRKMIWSIVEDITERKRAERALVSALDEAERATRAKSEFLSSMSHELRTPMNAILGFAQLLDYDKSLSPQQRDSIREILTAGDHLLALINDVLDLARIEAGRIDLSPGPVEVAPLVDECLALMGSLAAKHEVRLSYRRHPAYAVHADSTRLKQALLNLLSNAVKYNRKGGSVEVGVLPAVTEDRLRIVITDTGAGISPERLPDLFQPFSRLGAERGEIEGTGIGLVLTRRITELMGGTLGVESEFGVGSSFWLELPLAETLESTFPHHSHRTDSEPAPLPSGTNAALHTVLYIEDNPASLKLVDQVLARRGGVRLLTAHTPELGFELALQHDPELVLLDINLPGIDGFGLLERLREDPRVAEIPVVAITANAMPGDIERGAAAGFAAYLTKPLSVERLFALLDRYLAGTSSGVA